MRRALITGISGQDGCYLADRLLGQGYEVHGTTRRAPAECFVPSDLQAAGLRPLGEMVQLHQFADPPTKRACRRLLSEVQPDEFYNLAAQSFIPAGDADPAAVMESAGKAPLWWAVVSTGVNRQMRMLQAASSAMFGSQPHDRIANEQTPLDPQQPYAAAKAFAHTKLQEFREQLGGFVASAILFNHESPLRGRDFVTRKISLAAARIARGEPVRLTLGNLDARRDWGFAGDYVQAMWQMLQQDTAEDYVVATGVTHSVREFVELAFGHLGLDWREHVDVEPSLVRANDAGSLAGDASKARRQLTWEPRVPFEQLGDYDGRSRRAANRRRRSEPTLNPPFFVAQQPIFSESARLSTILIDRIAIPGCQPMASRQ